MISPARSYFRCIKDRLTSGFLAFSISAIIMVLGMGCADSGDTRNGDYLIRVRTSIISVGEFKKTFEIAESAYTHNEMQDPSAYRAAQKRLLNQLIEELVLIERAKDLNIRIEESEIASAVAGIKKDYPEGDFEKMLLDYAVSYPIWEKRLKRRLLMEKVIDEELTRRIAIEPKEILAYYDAHLRSSGKGSPASGNIDEAIVTRLRRKKTEDAFLVWIKTLQDEYGIEINQKQWEKIANL